MQGAVHVVDVVRAPPLLHHIGGYVAVVVLDQPHEGAKARPRAVQAPVQAAAGEVLIGRRIHLRGVAVLAHWVRGVVLVLFVVAVFAFDVVGGADIGFVLLAHIAGHAYGVAGDAVLIGGNAFNEVGAAPVRDHPVRALIALADDDLVAALLAVRGPAHG